MKDPAILFYTSDFITGTLTMTDEQRGKYIILLCLQHQQGYLTEEDMLHICKTYDEKIFSKFEKDMFGNYHNNRMLKETERRNKYSESRRNNRLQKTDNNNKICKSYDKHMENENININIDDNIKELYKGIEIFFDEDCRPKTEKAKHEWYETLDKLIRIDGYSPEHIHDVIKRARMDDFWRTNFLSVLKLRKKNKEGIMYFTVFEKKILHETTGRNSQKPASGEELTSFYSERYGIK